MRVRAMSVVRQPRRKHAGYSGWLELREPLSTKATQPVIVTGVIGSDTHIVGNRILSMALEQAGYKVVALGALTPAADFSTGRVLPLHARS